MWSDFWWNDSSLHSTLWWCHFIFRSWQLRTIIYIMLCKSTSTNHFNYHPTIRRWGYGQNEQHLQQTFIWFRNHVCWLRCRHTPKQLKQIAGLSLSDWAINNCRYRMHGYHLCSELVVLVPLLDKSFRRYKRYVGHWWRTTVRWDTAHHVNICSVEPAMG